MIRILLAGGTGLVGRQTVPLLLAQGHEVHLVARRDTGLAAPGLHHHIGPASDWAGKVPEVAPEIVISCLGTTWAKAGKSESAFRAVDQHLVTSVMEAAREAGARHAIAISSVGADARSRSFYLRVKGEVEAALASMGFDRLDILRPGLLKGNRGAERRPGEQVAMLLSPLTDALMSGKALRRYRSIESASVARAVASLATAQGSGRFTHHHDEIVALAR